MNLKILGILLGLFLISVAIWDFDWNNWNKIIVSTLLFLSGLSNILTAAESKTLQTWRSFLLYAIGFIIILFIFKILFVG